MPGSVCIDFDPSRKELLVDQWGSPEVSWQLRALCLISATIFHEQGAGKLRIRRLLGNDEFEREEVSPFSRGLAAEVSIWEFPSVSGNRERSCIEDRHVAFVADRINMLFCFGPGRHVTARYGEKHDVWGKMLLEVPANGFTPDSLGLWHEFGNTGRILSPRKKLLINE